MLSRAGRGEPAPCHLRVGPAESIPASPPGVQTPEEGLLEHRNSILRETSLSVSRTGLSSWGEGAFRKVLSAAVTPGRVKGASSSLPVALTRPEATGLRHHKYPQGSVATVRNCLIKSLKCTASGPTAMCS